MELIVLFALAAQLINAETSTINCDQTKRHNFPLHGKNIDLTVTFTTIGDCFITVTGYKMMEFNTTVPKITYPVDASCTYDFVEGTTISDCLRDPDPPIKICNSTPVLKPAKSKNQEFFLFLRKLHASNQAGPESGSFSAEVTFRFNSIQGDECGSSVITLSNASQMIQFPPPRKTFTNHSECDVKVNGFNGRNFKMTVPQMTLFCDEGYLAADPDPAALVKPHNVICGDNYTSAIRYSYYGVLYLKFLTYQPGPTFSLLFETIQGKECGPPEIQLSRRIETIQFPANNMSFTNHSYCEIKVHSYRGQQLRMNISQIDFDCKCGYIAAASEEAGLDNPNAQKCGTEPVTDAAHSSSGVMYLRIVTNCTTPRFTLVFKSGSSKPKDCRYVLYLLLIWRLLSETIY